jgi:hypothetical protein
MKLYTLFCLAVLGLFTTSVVRGWELGGSKRGLIPKEARQGQGGYRAYSFWRGGK